ncbi:hypothetical protein SLS57_004372 [Botryosphaeria dothidea]
MSRTPHKRRNLDAPAIEQPRPAPENRRAHDHHRPHTQRQPRIHNPQLHRALHVRPLLFALLLAPVHVVLRVVELARLDQPRRHRPVRQVRRARRVDEPHLAARGRAAPRQPPQQRLRRRGVVAEGRADDEVVLRGDGGGGFDVVEVAVQRGCHARAVGGGEQGGAVGAADEAGYGRGAEGGGGGGVEEVGEDGAADVAGGAGEEDAGRWG